MKKRLLSNLVMLLCIAALAPAASHAAPERYVPNEIIVKFRETAANTIEKQLQSRDSAGTLNLPRDLERLSTKYRVSRIKPLLKDFRERQQRLKSLRKKNGRLLSQREKRILERLKRAPAGIKVPDLGRIYKIKFENGDGQSLEKALEAYRSNPDVEYAELDYIVSVDSTPNDPLYSAQWSLSQINAPEAWDVYTGSSQTIVAVVDTGVDYNHRDLRDNMWVNEAELNGTEEVDDDENGYVDDIYGYNFIYNHGDPIDDYGHGTHCSGVIAAKGDNGLDITGICWNTRIMALKFMGPYGDGSASDAALAFYYAVANGADIISNSWSAKDESELLEDAIDYAHSQGVIIVASAGNGNSDEPVYPAGYQHVISVAATDPNDNKWPGSNYGDWVDIAAPGAAILSLRAKDTLVGKSNDEYTAFLTGTSAACPHIAGACALMLSANPLMTFGQLYNTLTRTADPIEPGTCFSDGRVNLSEAMHAVVPSRGYISFDHEYYNSSGVVSMLLADWDLKGNGSQEVTIMTSADDLEKVLLTETTPAFGVFTGTISISSGEPNKEDGMIQVSSDEVFTVVYFDANDGTGRPAAKIDSALMDCEAPMLFFVDVQTHGPVANVTFLASEPTRAKVQCGPAPGGPYTFVKENVVMNIIHTIKLQPVALNTDYYFIIELVDAVGNETIADNNGLCYSFTTPAEFAGFYVPSVYPTIQAAIDDASDGDTIRVADGQYTGKGNFDIDFHGKAITVKSENGPENCIVDCQFQGRGFDFHSGEDENSVLDGFTIANGSPGEFGGGIKCSASSPTIANCIITRNIAQIYGGGVCNIYNSSPILTNCTFSENSAKSTIDRPSNGGGMCNLENSSPIVSNCLFIENSAHEGSGMFNENSGPKLIGCTFSGNYARDEFT